MSRGMAPRLAWGATAASAALFAATVALGLTREAVPAVGETARAAQDLVFLGAFVLFAAAGAVIVSHQPRNVIGWLFVGIGVTSSVNGFTFEYAVRALYVSPGSLPLGAEAAWLGGWFWITTLVFLNLMLLLFPDGRFRWLFSKLLVWATVGAGAVLLASAVVFWPERGPELLTGEDVPEGLGGSLFDLAVTALLGIVVLSIAMVFARFVRSRGEERQQMKWFAFAAVLLGIDFLISELDLVGPDVLPFVDLVAILAIPASVAIAVLKYRLYDIDVVINKALVYTALAAFVTAVYVGVVVGIGGLIGAGLEANLALQIGATALVALAFGAVRERVQQLANRLVFGRRVSPYELLAGFSERVAGSYALEEALPRIARLVVEGTGADRASVWLRIEGALRRAATWPGETSEPAAVPLADDFPDLPGAARAYPVRHHGELLGALAVSMGRGEALRPEEDRLVAELAAQAALVLRNVRLTAELEARLEDLTRQAEELRTSRRRVVAAQDAERRRLERDIHDGAQQHLVALAVNLRLARSMAAKDREKARAILARLRDDVATTTETLRDLARGIYPPLLAERGLAAALEADAARAPVPVGVRDDGIGRPSPDVEAAAYFAALEGLQNAAKYAEPSRVDVRLWIDDGDLRFTVEDDGRGFDPASTPPGSGLRNLADRLGAVGGTVDVRSAPGAGTTVEGRIPLREQERVA